MSTIYTAATQGERCECHPEPNGLPCRNFADVLVQFGECPPLPMCTSCYSPNLWHGAPAITDIREKGRIVVHDDRIRKLSNEQLIAEATGWQTTPHARVLGERLQWAVEMCRTTLAALDAAERETRNEIVLWHKLRPDEVANLRIALRNFIQARE